MMAAIPITGVLALVAIVALHWFRRRLKKKQGRHILAHILSILTLIGAYGLLGLTLLFGVFTWSLKGSLVQNLGNSSSAPFDGATNLAFAQGDISENTVTGAELVRFPESDSINFTIACFRWEYDFNGFERATLSVDEARTLRKAIINSQLAPAPPYASKLTHQEISARGERGRIEYEEVLGPAASPHAEKKIWISINAEGVSTSVYMPPGQAKSGMLVFHLTRGRTAYVRVLLGQNGFFVYVPAQRGSSMNALYGRARSGRDVLEAAFTSATPNEIEILYPDLSAEKAVDRAASEFGDIYRQTVRYVETTPEIVAAAGPIREVRPAKGPNSASHWMDFGANFYFRVRGERGDALVRADLSDNTRTLEMLANGKFTEIPQRFFDWSGGKRP